MQKLKTKEKIGVKKTFKHIFILTAIFLLFGGLTAVFCSCSNKNIPKTIKVYMTETKQTQKLDFDDYISGVVEAEIGEDAPKEAIKAQAVLARTFALNFMKNNKSKYENADISDDITEAQAYKKSTSSKIERAVKETKDIVLKCNKEYINPLFFANSGGVTATASEGLGLSSETYNYIKSVKSPETENNSNSYSWNCTLSKNQILNATRNMGVNLANVSTFKKGETGESGRCKTFIIGGKEIDANTFRIQVGSTILKSTLIDNISVSSSSVTISGKGYGHGVGLSQEGAIVLAKEGKSYKEILDFYFKNISIEKA